MTILSSVKGITSSVTGFFSGKLRLWIEYVLIALLLAVAGFAVYSYIAQLKLKNDNVQLHADLATANQRVDAVEQVNAQQQEAINTIKGVRSLDQSMLQGLVSDLSALRVKDTTVFNKLSALEKSNEAVRQYFDSAVPDSVGCVLDDTCPKAGAGSQDANGAPASASSAPAVVQKTDTRPVQK